jgi:hypothetical protein
MKPNGYLIGPAGLLRSLFWAVIACESEKNLDFLAKIWFNNAI